MFVNCLLFNFQPSINILLFLNKFLLLLSDIVSLSLFLFVLTPPLLSLSASRVFFKVVIHFGSKSLLSELFNVLLERSLCLYNVTSYDEEIRK